MRFKIGVIGATGFIGTPYRREIRGAGEGGKIMALCARRREPLEAAAKEDDCDFITDNWKDVVQHPEVNLVLILTPDALHFEAAMASAEAGKHLFCDKPVGVDASQAYKIWSAYRETRLAHYVPYWARYEPAFLRARQIISEGTLGEIRGIVYSWRNPRPIAMPFTWRDDATLSAGGSIADVGSHAYDAVRWLTGLEAKRVLTHGDVISPAKPDLGSINLAEALDWGNSHSTDQAKTRKGTAFDYAAISWEFGNGAVGSLTVTHASVFRKGLTPEIEIHGTKASLALDRIHGTIGIVNDGESEPLVEEVKAPRPINRWGDNVFPALESRLDGRGSDQPGLFEGYRVQVFTDAAAESARRGAWVELSEVDPAATTA